VNKGGKNWQISKVGSYQKIGGLNVNAKIVFLSKIYKSFLDGLINVRGMFAMNVF